MKNNNVYKLLAVLVIASMALAACGGGSAPQAPVVEDPAACSQMHNYQKDAFIGWELNGMDVDAALENMGVKNADSTSVTVNRTDKPSVQKTVNFQLCVGGHHLYTDWNVIAEYITVAGSHPKTLDFILTNSQQTISGCEPWITQNGVNLTFAPGLEIAEGSYTCVVRGEPNVVLVTDVKQVEPIPHFDKLAIVSVTAGKENIVYIESAIPPGNASFEFSGLQPWMVLNDQSVHNGSIVITPPNELAGQQFTFVIGTTDWVNLSMTETITMTVVVVQ
jgi:tRNA-binding EMAP/Myf-like protein